MFNSTCEGDLVADFFVGSGTTAVASKYLNRKYIGFEINKNYYDSAKNRISNLVKQEEIDFEKEIK